ncbi:MAG: hypothetical protein LBJ92_03410 [Holosporales bacterium]|jgi:diaminopimelate epimerase|nr:hypothetical protein [Holosporales bacterium]
MATRFVKAQTNGNDFVILEDCVLSAEKCRSIAGRRTGIGCDQIIIVKKLTSLRYELTFYNSDGTKADMCGNGTCAAALYVINSIGECRELTFEISGREYRVNSQGSIISLFVEKPQLLEQTPEYQIVSTGNRHLVCGMEKTNSVNDLAQQFSDCNIHFVDAIDQDTIRMKTFERGAGWTMACGSGALAVAFARSVTRPLVTNSSESDLMEGETARRTAVYLSVHEDLSTVSTQQKNDCGELGKRSIVHDGGISIVEHHGDLHSLSVEPTLVFEGEIYD